MPHALGKQVSYTYSIWLLQEALSLLDTPPCINGGSSMTTRRGSHLSPLILMRIIFLHQLENQPTGIDQLWPSFVPNYLNLGMGMHSTCIVAMKVLIFICMGV